MREGADFITSKRVKNINLHYIVKRLNQCSLKYGSCEGCPDLKVCVTAYDKRCDGDSNVFAGELSCGRWKG